MTSLIEKKIYTTILSWLQTHQWGISNEESIATHLAQRVATRLERANMLKEDPTPEQSTERI